MNDVLPYTLNEDLVCVTGLNVSYDKPILRDLNLTIRNVVRPGLTQGQIVSVLAPSGMGKSQCFRCIAGIQKPNSGYVLIGAEKTPVQAGMVGVVAQDYPLFAHLTVFDNVYMMAKRSPKVTSDKQARDETTSLLASFGLAECSKNYPHQISGGQRQRVAILQSMVSAGHTLLMDEPFSGLDPNRKDEVEALIQGLAASDELNTIILTTHDIAAAIAVSDTIHLLGRDRDAQGVPIPGARIQKTYDLMEMGLAWHPTIQAMPEFHALETEIRAKFKEL